MKFKIRINIVLILLIVKYQLSIVNCFSQSSGLGINTTGAPADKSAMLDVNATGKGLLIPRMTTTQRPANPVESLMIYDSETQCFEAYNAATSQWVQIACIGAPWKCGDTLPDKRNGKKYPTVQIGTQCWMAKNMNIGTRIDGVNDMTNNSTIEKYCYDNLESNCDVYGGLYQWDEMMQYVTTEKTQGICPTGWHVASNGEWIILTDYLGGFLVSGGQLKEAGYIHWNLPNYQGYNGSGFSALPGGIRAMNPPGAFSQLGDFGTYSTSTESKAPFNYGAFCRYLDKDRGVIVTAEDYKTYGFSVRCVMD